MLRALAPALALLAACAAAEPQVSRPAPLPLFPNETPTLRAKINHWAEHYELPRRLVHRLAVRESTHRPEARNGPYRGLLQIHPRTAAAMGYDGPPEGLLDADTNLEFALKYLKGAWIVADGDPDEAIQLYARGYNFDALVAGEL